MLQLADFLLRSPVHKASEGERVEFGINFDNSVFLQPLLLVIVVRSTKGFLIQDIKD